MASDKYQEHPLLTSEDYLGLGILADAIAVVEAKDRMVEIIHLHPLDFEHLKANHENLLDFDTSGEAFLWGSQVWLDEEEPGHGFVQGFPDENGVVWEAHMEFLGANL